MRIFHRLPPSISAKHCPFGKATTCAGSINGTLVLLMRSWVLEVKAVLPVGSELSVAPLVTVVAYTSTLGSCRVSSSAVAVSRTRSMNRLLKLPTTCPALARLPMRASMSESVWV
ncbi:hypothetical protein D3C72_1825890 [compost metagenome]